MAHPAALLGLPHSTGRDHASASRVEEGRFRRGKVAFGWTGRAPHGGRTVGDKSHVTKKRRFKHNKHVLKPNKGQHPFGIGRRWSRVGSWTRVAGGPRGEMTDQQKELDAHK